MKVAHLTSAHPRLDTRIFHKQCRSLATAGHRVHLVVADGQGEERRDGVTIVDAGRLPGRLNRVLRTTRRVERLAASLDADVYHLHDPELLPVGLRLKRRGKAVIYDAHEDLPRQVLAKHYLSAPARRAISRAVEGYQRRACARFDAVVAATPHIRDLFAEFHPQSVDVNNFPLHGELIAGEAAPTASAGTRSVCYVGSIGSIRGIREIVRAMERLSSSCRLQLAGRFSEASVEREVRDYAGWSRVDALGHLDRAGVRQVMTTASAGLVTLHPMVNYLDALPVKMFEYMSAGLPVIASDFPLWRRIITDSDCGLCVDPLDPSAIAEAIDYLATHPERAREMGENGQRAVAERFNWAQEERKLLGTYERLSRGARLS